MHSTSVAGRVFVIEMEGEARIGKKIPENIFSEFYFAVVRRVLTYCRKAIVRLFRHLV